MKSTNYKYKKLPLTPNICTELIMELFNGKLETRQTIVDEITKVHLERGGREPNALDKPRMVKKALEKLQKEGLANNPIRGYWQIEDEQQSIVIDTSIVPEEIDDKVNLVEENKEEYDTEVVLGQGDGSVYLYYLPSYQKNREKATWPCKIGKSNSDPLQRIISQASTALPEKPKVAVIIRTNNPHALEQAVHNILIYRNKKVHSAIGKEWFDTNPDEFLKIVQFIEQSTLLFE